MYRLPAAHWYAYIVKPIS